MGNTSTGKKKNKESKDNTDRGNGKSRPDPKNEMNIKQKPEKRKTDSTSSNGDIQGDLWLLHHVMLSIKPKS